MIEVFGAILICSGIALVITPWKNNYLQGRLENPLLQLEMIQRNPQLLTIEGPRVIPSRRLLVLPNLLPTTTSKKKIMDFVQLISHFIFREVYKAFLKLYQQEVHKYLKSTSQ
jgi:hypothetical protein